MGLASEDTLRSLREGPHSLDGKMREVLGEQYQGHIALSAQPAFIALSGDLPVDSPLGEYQRKFLPAMSQDELRKASGIDQLASIIEANIPDRGTILSTNLRKLTPPLNEAADTLDHLTVEQFRLPAARLSEQIARVLPELEQIAQDATKGLKTLAAEMSHSWVYRVRRQVTQAIDAGLSGDDGLKQKIEAVVAQENAGLPALIEGKIAAVAAHTQAAWAEQLELIGLQLRHDDAFHNPAFAHAFDHVTTVETHTGVKWSKLPELGMSLLMSGLGSWQAKLNTVLSIIDIFKGLFSTNHSKSEQIRSMNENLTIMRPKIEMEINSHLQSAKNKLRDHILGKATNLRTMQSQLAEADRCMVEAVAEFRIIAASEERLQRHVAVVTGPPNHQTRGASTRPSHHDVEEQAA